MNNEINKLSPWWWHSTILVMIIGFSILSYLTFITYKSAPPIPKEIIIETGDIVFTGDDIRDGQEIFLKYGLMEHGSLWGHGAYLGPDYTAFYLHSEAIMVQETFAQQKYSKSYLELSDDEKSVIDRNTIKSLKTNRYNPNTNVLIFTMGELIAYQTLYLYWTDYFSQNITAPGLPFDYIKNSDELGSLTAFFAWATWATVANRPGQDYSYTNNWPYEPLAGNYPSVSTYLWSALSLIALLAGLGLVLFLFGKFSFLGVKGDEHELPSSVLFPQPPSSSSVAALSPSQLATGKYFLIIALLFLLQAILGVTLAYYRIETGSFYFLDIAKWFPYNLLRTWHLQLAIFWIATTWIAGGLFLATWVGGKEPAGQKLGVNVLLAALVIVILGSLFGEALGLQNKLKDVWFWFGHQGLEYLDLGRFWQILFIIAMVFWTLLMFRALRPAIRFEGKSDLSALFLYAAIAIPLFYLPALFFGSYTNFAVIDNWRFWIIHLWVEGFFELFATVLVAIMFRYMGLVTSKTATRLVYLAAIIYFSAVIVGTGHHWYFSGQGTLNMGLAACFSALEVVPLTLLILDAWDFIRLKNKTQSGNNHEIQSLVSEQKWTIYFLMAVGVWNFVGAGIFGFLINLPIISYFERGTLLTANHAHAAMFGVFGMLALSLLVFCLRAQQTEKSWQKVVPWIRIGFFGTNLGLGLMIVLDLFPAGVLQFIDVIENGYWHARSLAFTTTGKFHWLEWIRLIGDVVFILFGAIPLTYASILTYFRKNV
ncbi:MAG: cbb3-type cytochrome c oxidase subunit I [Oligoflexia bacterium]|nr:cbb3-type cytochrome c oxidase subunit I [Oligoflexia bacterium]